ncbi:glycoside hydrolase family 28 protein [Anditalea andensis]|uniref:Polygalacturonase n=1 Tax=Anditalea andensis TaxID=1048983 RepID=A0A074LKA9_9BACT|nr:glycoside hydrolase family 28 protein [Anditalea andensis]KEO74252.1 polygalacturonase [Anditalea andensis]
MYKILFIIGLSVLITVSPAYSNDKDGWYNILKEGGNNVGELTTEAIKNAINKASEAGGGTIYFPAGEYLTGAIELKSNITLHLDAGAVLKFSTDFDHYLPFVKLRWEGTVMNSFSPLIYGYEAENIAIVGRGKIDGQGEAWWKEMYRVKYPKEELPLNRYQKMWDEQNPDLETADYYQGTMKIKFFRPPLIQPFKCKNIRIEGITIVNSPFWTINPAFSENITITGVTILNPPSPNTDGINPTSCKNVRISDCHISVGDDCITIKSGRDMDGRKYATPTENVTITNCTMLSGHGGVVIGSEVSGDIKKVTITNCVFDGTKRGIRLKSARGRGGTVEEIRVSNVVMKNIGDQAIVLDLFYDPNTEEEPVTERTPTFRNIHISNVTGSNVNVAGHVKGITEMPIDNLTFTNINMEAKKGFSVHTATNVEFHNVEISTEEGPSFKIEESENIILNNVKSRKPLENSPVVELVNVSNILIHNNFPMVETPNFLKVGGANSSKIIIKNNYFQNSKNPIIKGNDLRKDAIQK